MRKMLKIDAIIEQIWLRRIFAGAVLFATVGVFAFGLIVAVSDSAFADSGDQNAAVVEVDASKKSDLRGWKIALRPSGSVQTPRSQNVAVNVCLKNVGGKWRVEESCDYESERIYFWAPLKKIYPGKYAPDLLEYAVIESDAIAVVEEKFRDRIRLAHKKAEKQGESALRNFSSRFAELTEWDDDGLLALAVEQADEIVERDRQIAEQKRQEAEAQAIALYRQKYERIKESNDPLVLREFVEKYDGKDSDGFIPLVVAKIEDIRLATYRAEFEKAEKSSNLANLRAFVGKYENNDPDGLIARAIAKIEKILLAEYRAEFARINDSGDPGVLREFMRKHWRKDPDGFIPRIEQKIAAVVRDFRANLAAGDISHCGLVIEAGGAVVKLQTIVGEHWLKTSQIYPENAASCRFVNNVYQDPRLNY